MLNLPPGTQATNRRPSSEPNQFCNCQTNPRPPLSPKKQKNRDADKVKREVIDYGKYVIVDRWDKRDWATKNINTSFKTKLKISTLPPPSHLNIYIHTASFILTNEKKRIITFKVLSLEVKFQHQVVLSTRRPTQPQPPPLTNLSTSSQVKEYWKIEKEINRDFIYLKDEKIYASEIFNNFRFLFLLNCWNLKIMVARSTIQPFIPPKRIFIFVESK